VSTEELTTRFLLAAAIILVVCRVVSMLVRRIGQPPVVGEMLAGVLLGPSLFGAVAPGWSAALFPKDLLPVIYVAGQLGLVALMFQAGRELRGYLRPGLGRAALTVSSLGVVVPLVAGAGMAYAFHTHVGITEPGVSPAVTAVFVGVTLAITAFPMLARIIIERGLSGTRYGSLALASGGIDDFAAWLMLAAVLSVASGRPGPIVTAVVGAAIFAAILIFVLRPLLDRWLTDSRLSPETALIITMVLVLGAAGFTTSIGLYAVFGAFSIGLVMPPQRHLDAVPATTGIGKRTDLVTPTMDGISRMLVPMFFTYSGLHTRFALLTDPRVLWFSVAAIVVAVISKGGACWLGARLAGERGWLPVRIGTLMNARGLMQLIALNVGLQAGIASPTLFTSLVLVAMVTTIMTSPILALIDRIAKARGGLVAAADSPAEGAA